MKYFTIILLVILPQLVIAQSDTTNYEQRLEQFIAQNTRMSAGKNIKSAGTTMAASVIVKIVSGGLFYFGARENDDGLLTLGTITGISSLFLDVSTASGLIRAGNKLEATVGPLGLGIRYSW